MFTPKDSDRRSNSGLESGNVRSSEDIRNKLARYKKEREDFEMLRQ